MTLGPGAQLGRYEIPTLIGEGGPPPLVFVCELRRDLAEAQARTR